MLSSKHIPPSSRKLTMDETTTKKSPPPKKGSRGAEKGREESAGGKFMAEEGVKPFLFGEGTWGSRVNKAPHLFLWRYRGSSYSLTFLSVSLLPLILLLPSSLLLLQGVSKRPPFPFHLLRDYSKLCSVDNGSDYDFQLSPAPPTRRSLALCPPSREVHWLGSVWRHHLRPLFPIGRC